jgi:stage II sporulation protein D
MQRLKWLRYVLGLGLGVWAVPGLQSLHLALTVSPSTNVVWAQEAVPEDPLYFARWNINYGEYLIDVGKYLEAMEAFQTAIEATTNPRIRAEAYLQRASTLAIFLDAADEAARQYERLLQEHPQESLAETALYRLALLRFDQQQYQEAVEQFERYLRQYAQGRFAQSAEVLLSQSRQALEAKTPPSPPPPPPIIETKVVQRPHVRVRLLKATKQLDIRSRGRLTVATIAGQPIFEGQGDVTLRPRDGHIWVGQRSSKARELQITATAPVVVAQKNVQCGSKQAAAPGSYRGDLRVFLHNGTLQVINEVNIEAYLYGVVPVEVSASWPVEALKTQAIAARTYALYQAQHRKNWRHDLVDSQGDQVYKGLRCETTRTTGAVDATQGTILVHQQRPILAMYTSNAGWHSAHVEDVFDQALPYLVGVPDAYSPTQPMGRWKRVHEAEEIQRKLAQIGIRVEAIQDIIPQQVTPSGRIKKAALVHRHGNHVVRARTTLRRALNLPEILLKITRQDQTFTFEGGGFGHGVGLSQWGAKAMAAEGKSAQDILQFYYHDVNLKKMW